MADIDPGGTLTDDWLSEAELEEIGFRSLGRDVHISRRAAFYSPQRISVGDHSRVDAFAVLSAGQPGLSIGRNVHISAYACVLGEAAVDIGDFVALSVRSSIFSSDDDYSGKTMTGPTVPAEFRRVHNAPVRIGAHSVLGTGCVVLPGVTIGESVAAGALSLVKTDVEPFTLVAGIPARRIGPRNRGHRRLADQLLRDEAGSQGR